MDPVAGKIFFLFCGGTAAGSRLATGSSQFGPRGEASKAIAPAAGLDAFYRGPDSAAAVGTGERRRNGGILTAEGTFADYSGDRGGRRSAWLLPAAYRHPLSTQPPSFRRHGRSARSSNILEGYESERRSASGSAQSVHLLGRGDAPRLSRTANTHLGDPAFVQKPAGIACCRRTMPPHPHRESTGQKAMGPPRHSLASRKKSRDHPLLRVVDGEGKRGGGDRHDQWQFRRLR